MLREVFTTFKIRVDAELNRRGSVYTLFQGSYGFDTSVIIKEADISLKELVMKDIKFMQALKTKSCFPRITQYEESYGRIRVLQDVFEYNCTELLTLHSGSHNIRTLLGEFSMQELLAGVWRALSHLHGKAIIHRDIRSKNVFVRR